MLTLITACACELLCHEPALGVSLRPCKRDRRNEARGAPWQQGDTKRQTDGLADQSRQVNRQTNRAGAIPQRAMTRASASHLQRETRPSTEARGGAGGFPKTDTQPSANLRHTACNDWRHGCLPQGEEKKTKKKPTTGKTGSSGGGRRQQPQTCSSTVSSSRSLNGRGSINSSGSSNNKPNQP